MSDAKPDKYQVIVSSLWTPAVLALAVLLVWYSWPVLFAGPMKARLAGAAPVAQVNQESNKEHADAPKAEASAPERSDVENTFIEKAGQTGDSYGGLSALFAALAFVGVAWAGMLQHQQLVDARKSYALEHFEARFFQMLGLLREVTEQISISDGSKRGAHALRALAFSFADEFEAVDVVIANKPTLQAAKDKRDFLRKMVQNYVNFYYEQHPSELGPYFRALYQTFKHIDRASISDDEKASYASIARGQISEGTVLLLAVNGLSRRGSGFPKYIEKYGLLEHMHPRYLSKFKDYLLLAYDPLAFMGSKQRQIEILKRKQGESVPPILDSKAFQEKADSN